MAEFGVDAVFHATVAPDSLRNSRREIENKLGDIEVDVAVQTAGGGGGGGGPNPILREWDIEHDLSRERNLLLRAMLEEDEQRRFDRKTDFRVPFLGGAFITAIASITLGSGLISFLDSFEFDPPGEPDWLPITIPAPGWLPIPNPNGDGTGGGTGTGTPTPIPTTGPTPVPFTGNDANPQSEPQPQPEPNPGVGLNPRDVGTAAGAGGIAAWIASRLGGAGSGFGGAASGPGVPSIAPAIAEHAPDIFEFLPQPTGGTLASTGVATRSMRQPRGRRRDQRAEVTVENNPTYQVDSGDIRAQLQRQQEQNRREIEQKVNELMQQLGGNGAGRPIRR